MVREKEIKKKVEESEQRYDFEIAKESFFNQCADERADYEKYVYEPCYLSIGRLTPKKILKSFLPRIAIKLSGGGKTAKINRTISALNTSIQPELSILFTQIILRNLLTGGLEFLKRKI